MWRDTVHKRILILLIILIFSHSQNFVLLFSCLFSLILSQSNLLPTYPPSSSPKWAEPVSILKGDILVFILWYRGFLFSFLSDLVACCGAHNQQQRSHRPGQVWHEQDLCLAPGNRKIEIFWFLVFDLFGWWELRPLLGWSKSLPHPRVRRFQGSSSFFFWVKFVWSFSSSNLVEVSEIVDGIVQWEGGLVEVFELGLFGFGVFGENVFFIKMNKNKNWLF